MKEKKKTIINVYGHKWFILDEKSKLGSKYIVLERVSFLSDLKKYGQVATKIDYYIGKVQ